MEPYDGFQKGDVAMGAVSSVLYGALAYVLFLGTFLYAIAFVGRSGRMTRRAPPLRN